MKEAVKARRGKVLESRGVLRTTIFFAAHGGKVNKLIVFFLGMVAGWFFKLLIDGFPPGVTPAEQETVPARLTTEVRATQIARNEAPAPARDDLKVINGIGPVIERKLNEAGIYSFEQLGSLQAEDLRRILGKTIQRLADEEALLRQARELAGRG
jgi:predicted flap endonuclease-1-like 5' DNA nuclease